ncbi:MAG: hypothetical protein JKY48_19440, partial [Flavobacteriales bacterium]|nr:hypothetical protein [Flavobacteriales bacterium]
MKKFIFLSIGVLSFSMSIMACDLCSIYMNLEPNDLKNSFGVNYRVRSFDHNVISNSIIQNSQKHAIGNTVLSEAVTQKELFKSYDLWINYFVKPKWQIFANISFSDNSYFENDSLLHNISGPGDLTLIVKNLVY